MRRVILAAPVVLTALVAACAAQAENQALYRQGLPHVLEPAATTPRAEVVLERYRAAYAARQQPRIAVYWNRDLSDRVATTYREDLRLRQSGGYDVTTTRDVERYSDGSSALVQASGGFDRTLDASHGESAEVAARRSGMAERADWAVESTFSQALLSAGSRLVDRAVMIRTADGAQEAGDRPNIQALEMAALAGKADLLMEVLQTPDSQAPTGFSFRITVKDVDSGALIASLVTRAEPQQPQSRNYVATSRGFQAEAADMDAVGRQLATEAMASLVAAWGG